MEPFSLIIELILLQNVIILGPAAESLINSCSTYHSKSLTFILMINV